MTLFSGRRRRPARKLTRPVETKTPPWPKVEHVHTYEYLEIDWGFYAWVCSCGDMPRHPTAPAPPRAEDVDHA